MEIYRKTGVLKSDEQRVTKSIASLLFASTRGIEDLTNETISLWIERANGGNVDIAINVKLKDYLILSAYGGEAMQHNAEFKLLAVSELAEHAVRLAENESIKFALTNLVSTETYAVYGMEDALLSETVHVYERKTFASEDVNKTIDVAGYDLGVLSLDSNVLDVALDYGNSTRVKMLPIELLASSREIDPILAIRQDGTVVHGLESLVSIPLVGVKNIEINKLSGNLVTLLVRTAKYIG